jgi:2-deoxy-D-gluconate 3-dehydrogenase
MIRRALVTGGGSGIGAGIARVLASRGFFPILVGRRSEALSRIQAEIREAGADAASMPWDIGRGESAEELVSKIESDHGPMDILVHAAGNQFRSPALEFPVEAWDSILGLHLTAAFRLSQAVASRLVSRGCGGSIVFIGSMTSERLGHPNTVAYAAAKSGLLGLMRTLAVEWGPHKIRSNAILVGFVATEMTRDLDNQPSRKRLVARAPLGGLAAPADIGEAAAFLASDAARFVTGSCMTVDGGWSIA